MKKEVLFIQGGGNGGYKADQPLVASLQTALGSNYTVHYPQMLPDETAPDFAPEWLRQIDELVAAQDALILAGHSLGASLLLKYLSENSVRKGVAGVFLVAPPFWSGTQDWVQPLKLQQHFADKLPKELPVFFYQCKDDEVVPFDHFKRYQQQIPWAVFRELSAGGHQFDNDLSIVAADIEKL
ncbi:alpha/beta fold hydrolase [Chitinophaga varians]|uniref:alpha/beta fold hydrolase n=1 Tax=Chitinophaga varians TaxID=2202339 RepID=UPI00165F750B|nr:alpha/beta fold hydrolase [Chitinophaga varians]MBC9909797.1 alpha/beta fold hydrolase [Chitinophaga varians]